MADWTGQRNGPDFSVDILKPKKKQLSIADLQQANTGVPGRYADPVDSGVGGDPLAEAKAFLAPYEAQDRAIQNEQLARKNVMAPEYAHSGLRGATLGLKALGEGVSSASLPGYVLGGPVGGAMQAIGGALQVPEYMRRRIAPDTNAGENQAGVLEGLGLGADVALGGYMGKGKAALERPVVSMMEGPARYSVDEGSPAAIRAFEEANNPSFQRALTSSQRAQEGLDSLLGRLNSGTRAEAGTVRNIGGLTQEAPGGLSDVFAGKVRPTPYRPLQSEANRILSKTPGEVDLSSLLPKGKTSRRALRTAPNGRPFRLE